MTIAVCGTCNVEMLPLDDVDSKFKCPNCGRVVDWNTDTGESGDTFNYEI